MRSGAMKTLTWKPFLPGTNQGFSLIEVLVTMAIFSFGIVAVMTLMLSTTRNNTNGNILTQATMLARAKVEEKKREADAGTPTNELPSNVDMQGNPGGIYTYECVVTPGSRQIQVTVSWTRRGQPRSVDLTTLY